MSTALRYRLFGAGKMPPALREASGGGVLVGAEGISVKETVTALRMPRASVAHGAKLLVGSVVVRPDRVLTAIGDRVVVDSALHDADRPTARLSLAEDGVRIGFDVADVLEGGAGTVEVHYRVGISAASLAGLPALACAVELLEAVPALLQGWKGTHAR